MTDFTPFHFEARAWIPKCDEQIYGGESKMFYQDDQYLSSFLRRVYDFQCKTHPSYTNEVLTWFSGFTDRNGRKVFEGDFVQLGDGKAIVKFSEGEFTAICNNVPGVCCNLLANVNAFVVVGNVFENPELLKEL